MKKRTLTDQGGYVVPAILLTLVLLIAGGILVHRFHVRSAAIAKERAQLVQAEEDMNALTIHISSKIGKPDSNSMVKSCGYTSNPNEFSKGDLYCSASLEMVYTVSDRVSAVELSTSLSTQLREEPSFIYKNSSSSMAGVNVTPVELMSQTLKDKSGISCGVVYTYFLDSDKKLVYSGSRSKGAAGLNMTFTCGTRPAKAAYYPIQNS